MSHANIIDILTEGASREERERISVLQRLRRLANPAVPTTVVLDSIGNAASNMGEVVHSFSNKMSETAQAFHKLAGELSKNTSPRRKRSSGKRRRGPPPRHVSKVSPKRGRR